MTKSGNPGAAYQQLTLFAVETVEVATAIPTRDPYWDEIVKPNTPTPLHPCDCVGGQVTSDTQKSAPQHDKPTHWIEKYWVERSENKYWYFRYCWMSGRKIHRRYIGSARSQLAAQRKQAIEEAISVGRSPKQIEQLINSWRS